MLVIQPAEVAAELHVQDALNEHYLRPGVSYLDPEHFNVNGSRMIQVFNYTVNLAVFPVSRFNTGHSYSVQQLYKVRPCCNPFSCVKGTLHYGHWGLPQSHLGHNLTDAAV